MSTYHRRVPFSTVAGASWAVVPAAMVLLTGAGGHCFGRSFSDLAGLAAAALAAVTAGVAAVPSAGRTRSMWASTAVACAGWGTGEAVWMA
ncbi:MAG: hypothetical protein NVS3B26_06910 [Mycobacteriales bacterium]